MERVREGVEIVEITLRPEGNEQQSDHDQEDEEEARLGEQPVSG